MPTLRGEAISMSTSPDTVFTISLSSEYISLPLISPETDLSFSPIAATLLSSISPETVDTERSLVVISTPSTSPEAVESSVLPAATDERLISPLPLPQARL